MTEKILRCPAVQDATGLSRSSIYEMMKNEEFPRSVRIRPAVSKVQETQRQRNMLNSWQQAHNLDGAFEVDPEEVEDSPVFLVDDIVDSRWSLTVAGALLRGAGSGPVLPLVLALASASNAG